MSTTRQTQAASVANSLVQLVLQAYNLKLAIDQNSATWTNLGVANMINAFPTAPALTTGALGTADGSPTVANPIDTRTVDGALLLRAISANDLASMLTYLQGISSCIGGTAVSANGAALSLIAKAS